MEPLTGLAIVSGAAMLFGLFKWGNRQEEDEWVGAAEAAGVVVDTRLRAFGFFHGLKGRVQGQPALTVEVTEAEHGTHIRVDGLSGVAALRLATEGIVERVLGQGDPRVGDDAFDRVLVIGGPAWLAQATLDAPTRAAVLAVFGGIFAVTVGTKRVSMVARAELKNGRLDVALMKSHGPGDGERLEGALRLVVGAATRLGAARDMPAALAAGAGGDPLPAVRLQSLRALARDFPDAPQTREALRAACDDPEDAVALSAALALGAAAGPVLLRLATASADEDVAAAALRTLPEALPPGQPAALLDDALRTRRFRKARAAIEVLAAGAGPDAAAAEPLLLAALASGDGELAEAAAQLLGRVGTAAAVLPLQESAGGLGVAARATALWAVDAIQARLRGATPGQLSLAGGESGQVSLADPAAGRVSLEGEE